MNICQSSSSREKSRQLASGGFNTLPSEKSWTQRPRDIAGRENIDFCERGQCTEKISHPDDNSVPSTVRLFKDIPGLPFTKTVPWCFHAKGGDAEQSLEQFRWHGHRSM